MKKSFKCLPRIVFIFSICLLCGFSMPIWWPFTPQPQRHSAPTDVNVTVTTKLDTKQIMNKSTSWVEQKLSALKKSATTIDNNILRLSLIAYQKAQSRGVSIKQQTLTVIDYSKPSTVKRLWVFDLKNNKTIFNTWVSHGRNSGGLLPHSFSNNMGSLKSSIGVYLTDKTYYGGKGYSMRIKGLEHGFNDNAFRRNVVVHGASYINAATIRKYGQVGRSWGCPAVSNSLIRPLINAIKNKSLLIVYYPDRNWLKQSRFLSR